MTVDSCTNSYSTTVDMNLASSYIPALTAITKVVLLLAMLTSMQKLGMPIQQSITTSAACLYIDRNLSLHFIVDTNACALCTLIAVAVNATRMGLDLDTTIVNYVVGGLWCMCSCFFICDLHRSFLRTLPVFEMSILFTSFFCGVHGFLSMTAEGDMFLYIRAILFTFFTVCWVYSERLHQVRDKQHFSFAPCLDRFGLILLVEWYAVLAFSSVVLCLLLWRQSRWLDSQRDLISENNKNDETQVHVPHRTITNSVDLTYGPTFPNEPIFKNISYEPAGKNSIGVIRPTIEKIGEEDEGDVFAAFLIAKENARKGSHRQ
jgi:hypothetical protein